MCDGFLALIVVLIMILIVALHMAILKAVVGVVKRKMRLIVMKVRVWIRIDGWMWIGSVLKIDMGRTAMCDGD